MESALCWWWWCNITTDADGYIVAPRRYLACHWRDVTRTKGRSRTDPFIRATICRPDLVVAISLSHAANRHYKPDQPLAKLTFFCEAVGRSLACVSVQFYWLIPQYTLCGRYFLLALPLFCQIKVLILEYFSLRFFSIRGQRSTFFV